MPQKTMQATDYTKKLLSNRKLIDMDIRPGDTVRVHERIQEGGKERVAIFEGLVIARRHENEPGASVTVRRITKGIGVERVFPLAMPKLEKIEIVRRAKVRRARLFYLRDLIGKRATLKGALLPPGFGQPTEQEIEAEKETEESAENEEGGEEAKGQTEAASDAAEAEAEDVSAEDKENEDGEAAASDTDVPEEQGEDSPEEEKKDE